MAKRTVTTTEFIDDLTGGKAEGTVSFAFEGRQYEIDLNKSNTNALRKALKPYIDAGRPVRGRRSAGKSRRGSVATADLAAIRDWARKKGYDVADRGRVPAAIVEEYAAAH